MMKDSLKRNSKLLSKLNQNNNKKLKTQTEELLDI